MYEYRLRKYIASYVATMNGVDVIVFTAGVGENSVVLREKVCENLTYLGVELDKSLNEIRSGESRRISSANSKVEVLVIPTNEELVIARDTNRIVQSFA
ncbi:acetate kinase [Paenibacillus pini JCM 16418]|uniref:Acetate kinase n=1 Tax=Paenibacillus pini JCM 16418 TaxID=1236976 RepID=W7YDX4_9BACL|nr:acetate kinase [Paenibacillus pini JCM 16418]